jgi:hypothetical protein
MQSGSQGISGKRTVNAMTMFDELFSVEATNEDEEDLEDDTELLNNLEK